MCGIVGYVGQNEAVPFMLEGLYRLEYRGYDSAGVVVAGKNGLEVRKKCGYVAKLDELVDGGKLLPGNTGIGHTRWATHGKPTDGNAHPHISCDGKVAIVHNGIIENYAKLRAFLLSEGFTFYSETDSEVAANVIAYQYKKTGDMPKAIAEAAKQFKGAYGLGIVCADTPDKIYAAKKESPLVLGVGDGCNYLASDVAALIAYTRDVYTLSDGEIATLSQSEISIYTPELEKIEKPLERVDWDIATAEKGGYEHFMMKEIMEQAEVVQKTIGPRIVDGRVTLDDLNISDDYIKGLSRIYMVACGSANHVGMVAKYNLEKLARIPTDAVLASEFRYSTPILDESTLVICISQSGTTADTIAALRMAKSCGAKVLSIVNVSGSVIAAESDWVLYTWAGPEIAVATTKAYSAQLAVTYLLAMHFADVRGKITGEEYSELISALEALPEKIGAQLQKHDEIKALAKMYYEKSNIFFIGRNVDYALSLEGSLKLKEISYIHSEAYAAGELKHGTLSLIEEGTLVVTVAAYKKLIDKTVSNAVEARSRGAIILAITCDSEKDTITGIADQVLTVADVHDLLLPSLAILPLQLFSYYMAQEAGREIDKPRNLAKSVTVE